jgi:alkyl sulfatase BDS1-like metallo-beta-lactamase superfamily hydrolase
LKFLYTPHTEAPAEIIIFIPDLKVLNLAENSAMTLHNLLSPRGAEVRDGLAWAKCLDDVLDLYGDTADIMIAQHHWPTFGNANIK